MLQDINFYHSLKRPGRYAVNVRRAKIIISSWTILLLIVLVVQGIYTSAQKIRLQYVVKKEKQMIQSLETLVAQSPKIKQTRELENTIQAFSEQINRKTNFIQAMTHYNEKAVAFQPADYLTELANAIIPKVWLTDIRFEQHGQQIHLSGFTLSASQLTKFVLQLQQEKHFQSKLFTKMMITDEKNSEKMAFILSTEAQKS